MTFGPESSHTIDTHLVRRSPCGEGKVYPAIILPDVFSRALEDELAAVHDENVVCNSLDFRNLVRREKNRGAIRRSLNHAFQQMFRGNRIQAFSRLIEDQQL